MSKQPILSFVSFLLGSLFSRLFMEMVINPCFVNFKQNLDTELFIAEILVFFSFSLSFLILFKKFETKKKKWYAMIGLFFPLFLTILSIGEKTDINHHYYDFWFLLFGSLLTTVIASYGTYDTLRDYSEIKEEENKETVPSTTNEEETIVPVIFEANETLTNRMNSIMEQIQETKNLFTSNIETLHELEKIERQLIESQTFFMAIGLKYKQEAEEKLELILNSAEIKIESYMDEHNQIYLNALDKILLQQN